MVRMNKALKLFEQFMDSKGLEAEVFTEKLREFPKGFNPNSIMTVKKGAKVLLNFACTRDNFWVELVDESHETKQLAKELEDFMKKGGIVQVR